MLIDSNLEAHTPADAPTKVELNVGESIPVAQSLLEAILPAERQMQQMLLNLGALHEKAHVESLQLQALVHAARKNFEEKVKEAGIGSGLSFDGDFLYNYSQEKRTFTRTK